MKSWITNQDGEVVRYGLDSHWYDTNSVQYIQEFPPGDPGTPATPGCSKSATIESQRESPVPSRFSNNSGAARKSITDMSDAQMILKLQCLVNDAQSSFAKLMERNNQLEAEIAKVRSSKDNSKAPVPFRSPIRNRFAIPPKLPSHMKYYNNISSPPDES